MSTPVRELSYPGIVASLAEQDVPVELFLSPGMAEGLGVFAPAPQDERASRLFPSDPAAESVNAYRLNSVNAQSCHQFWAFVNLGKTTLNNQQTAIMNPDLTALATVCESITGQEKVGDLVYLSDQDIGALASQIGGELEKLPRELFGVSQSLEELAQEIAEYQAELETLSSELEGEIQKILKENPKFEKPETPEDQAAARAAIESLRQKYEPKSREPQGKLEEAMGQKVLLEKMEKSDWSGLAKELILPALFQSLTDPKQEAETSRRPAFSQNGMPYYGYVVTINRLSPQFANAVTQALIDVRPYLSQPSAELMVHDSLKRLYRSGGGLEHHWIGEVEQQVNALAAALGKLPDQEAFWDWSDENYSSRELQAFRTFLGDYTNSKVNKYTFLEKWQAKADGLTLPQIESLTQRLTDSHAAYQKTLDSAEAREDRENIASYVAIGSLALITGASFFFPPLAAALAPAAGWAGVATVAIDIGAITGLAVGLWNWGHQAWDKDENEEINIDEIGQTAGLATVTGTVSGIGGLGVGNWLGGKVLSRLVPTSWQGTIVPFSTVIVDSATAGAIQNPLFHGAESVIKEGKLPTVAETKSRAWEGLKFGAIFGTVFAGLGLGYKLRAKPQGPATAPPPAAAGTDAAVVAAGAAPAAAVLANPNQLPDTIPPLKRTWGERVKTWGVALSSYVAPPAVLAQVPFIQSLPGLSEWGGILLVPLVRLFYSRGVSLTRPFFPLKRPFPLDNIGFGGALARSVGLKPGAAFHTIIRELRDRGLNPSIPRSKPDKNLKEILDFVDGEAAKKLGVRLTATADDIKAAHLAKAGSLPEKIEGIDNPVLLDLKAAKDWLSARVASRQPTAAAATGGAAASASPAALTGGSTGVGAVNLDDKIPALLEKAGIPRDTDWSNFGDLKEIIKERGRVLQQAGRLNKTDPEAQALVEIDRLLILGIFHPISSP